MLKTPPTGLRPLLRLVPLALLLAGCGSDPRAGRPIESLELIDFSVPGMFKQLAAQLGRASLLELPSGTVSGGFELRLDDTTERAALDAICRLDPGFQHSMAGEALVMWPTGRAEAESPFSRRLEGFRADGSVHSVLQELIGRSLPKNTILLAEAEGRGRPVSVDMDDVTVRSVLAEVAAQGHLSLVIEPGYVRVTAAPR